MTAVLCIIVAHTFPVHAEIDVRPLGQRVNPVHRMQLTMGAASGHTVTIPFTLSAAATPEDATDIIASAIEQAKVWGVRRQRLAVIVTGRGQSPVTKVTFKGDDPKPTVRWVSRQK